MEYNNKVNSTLSGFNANSVNDGACYEFLFNKSLGNGKHYNTTYDLNLLSELTGSLINNINNDESSVKKNTEEENTYTLDDLLDLAAVVPENDTKEYSFDGAFDFLSGEPQNMFTEFVMDTSMASPISSSSEESCDLDDLLFQDDLSELLPSTDINAAFTTELLESSAASLTENLQLTEEQVSITNSSYLSGSESSSDEGNGDVLMQLGFEEAAVTLEQNQVEFNQADLSALCSMLFQNQTMAVPEHVEQSPLESLLSMQEPSSPISSESGSDDVRYTPYKKTRKQKTPEQRKRKKSQNRTAASKYRVKKKDELQVINAEADELEGKNKVLRGKVDGLRTEIDYLKNLMLDVIKARLAKGTLPSNLLSVVL